MKTATEGGVRRAATGDHGERIVIHGIGRRKKGKVRAAKKQRRRGGDPDRHLENLKLG